MTNINNFNRDLNAEQVLGNYLDKYYYQRIPLFTNTKRVDDINLQHQGIDIIGTLNNQQQLLIDEKGLMSIPNPIPTFALELSYLNSDRKRVTGWLYDRNKHTTHYLFCWIKRDNISIKDVKLENIHYVLAMLISRTKLLNYLQIKYGINAHNAQAKVNQILTSNQTGRIENLSTDSNSRYHFSKQLPEQSINIVMEKRELLQSGAVESHLIVKKSGLSIPNY